MQQARGDADAAAATATLGAAGGLGDASDAAPQLPSQPPAAPRDDATAASAPQPKREDVAGGAAETAAAAAQANPFRSLGDAREAWRRSVAAAADVAEDAGAAGGDDDAPGDDAMDVAFERSGEGGDEGAPRQQALGAATQEQVDAQAGTHGGDDGDDGTAAASDDDAAADFEPAAEGTNGEDAEMEGADGSDTGVAGAAQAPPRGGGGARGGEGQESDHAMVVAEEPDLLEQAAQQASEPPHQGLVSVEDASAPTAGEVAADAPPPRPLAEHNGGAGEADVARGRAAFRHCSAATAALTGELVEQLRLVLQPTAANRMSGDYKTGKRLNMKKVISFIASGFRQDKIWLRRTKPDKRQYQLVLAIDETRSMQVCAPFAPLHTPLSAPIIQLDRPDSSSCEARCMPRCGSETVVAAAGEQVRVASNGGAHTSHIRALAPGSGPDGRGGVWRRRRHACAAPVARAVDGRGGAGGADAAALRCGQHPPRHARPRHGAHGRRHAGRRARQGG